jgi:opacity protein-like surface antigen
MYITKGLWAGAACILLVGVQGVAAADLPPKMVTKAPSVAPQYNWNGVYLGFNLGGSFGKQSFSQVTPAPGSVIAPVTAGSFPNGFIGGGQFGYNWQTYGWVLGLEADYQGSTEKDPQALVTATTGLAGGYNDKVTSFGTVRGRVGYAVGEFGNGLPYVTGGWAYARGSISGTAITATTTVLASRRAITAGPPAPVLNGEFCQMSPSRQNIFTSAMTARLGCRWAERREPSLGRHRAITSCGLVLISDSNARKVRNLEGRPE